MKGLQLFVKTLRLTGLVDGLVQTLAVLLHHCPQELPELGIELDVEGLCRNGELLEPGVDTSDDLDVSVFDVVEIGLLILD